MQRTIQFWRLVQKDGKDLGGKYPAQAIVKLLQQAAKDDLNRYHVDDDYEILGEGVRLSPHPLVALYRTRRANYPRVDDGGVISPLALRPGQALAEATYFAFLPRNIVALLFNNEGPRAARMIEYLNVKLSCDLGLVPILREDLDELLDTMRMTSVDISIPAAQAAMLAETDDGWADRLQSFSDLVHDGVIRVRLSVGRTGKKAERDQRTHLIRSLVDGLRQRSDLGLFNRARVEGSDEETASHLSVDLLEQKFISRVEVDPERPEDVAEAARIAGGLLDREYTAARDFLFASTPETVGQEPTESVGPFVDAVSEHDEGE